MTKVLRFVAFLAATGFIAWITGSWALLAVFIAALVLGELAAAWLRAAREAWRGR